MTTLREQFDAIIKRVEIISASSQRVTMDVVMLRRPGDKTRISIIGNQVSRRMYDQWVSNGARFRVLRRYRGGHQIHSQHTQQHE